MSPLARPLLALAAAALLHGAAAALLQSAAGTGDSPHCTTVVGGVKLGNFQWEVLSGHIDLKDSVVDFIPDRCPPESHRVAQEVTVCDPFGPPPRVALLGKGVHVQCTHGQGPLCPDGLNIKLLQHCD